MAQATKSEYYQALKSQGHAFDKHYRDYTTDELRELWAQRNEAEVDAAIPDAAIVPPKQDDEDDIREQIAKLSRVVAGLAEIVTSDARHAPGAVVQTQPSTPPPAAPEPTAKAFAHRLDPNEHAGITLNTHQGSDVLEVDQYGNEWFQKEVAKPAFPKPRGRRILRYDNPGVADETIKVGEYTETFEVSGDPKNARPAEIKITLPSYQTGIYKPPNMPFKVHTYNGVRGFDLEDVQKYYGGADLVPDTIKRCYVSTDLCYDIQSAIRTIENEYRERVLKTGRL